LSRFLVTGATGAIGTKVTAALLNGGFRVRGQYSRAPGADARVEWRQANFMQSLDVDRLVDGCDGVVHLAGELGDARVMQRVNVNATESLLKAATRAGVKYFGHASSMVVYGSPETRQIDETSAIVNPWFPMTKQYFAPPTTLAYSRTKAMAEMVIRQADPGPKLDIFRITKSAGFDRLLESLHWGLARRMMWLYGNTHCIFDEDCAQAIVHLAQQGLGRAGPQVEVYNIGDSTSGTYLSLQKRAARRLGRSRPGSQVHAPFLLEAARNAAKYRTMAFRYPTGMLTISNAKLLSTGFSFPVGYDRAVDLALNEYCATLMGVPSQSGPVLAGSRS
jgi:nucleoside-diphosphate-sugar epimerase